MGQAVWKSSSKSLSLQFLTWSQKDLLLGQEGRVLEKAPSVCMTKATKCLSDVGNLLLPFRGPQRVLFKTPPTKEVIPST